LLANWIPDPSPEFGSSPWPFVILMLVGFVVGTFGHIIKSKATVAVGIGLIFLGTLVLPLIVNLTKQ
jgi:hypothetical protein